MGEPKPVSTKEPGKILVIRGGAIGDFILSLPVLAALRENFPGIQIEILGYQRIAQLALASGLADRVRSIDSRPLASFFAKAGALPTELCEYFNGFALIISYLYDPDGIFRDNVARCSKAQFIVGPHRPDENGSTHATEVFLKPLERLAIFEADATPRLTLRGGEDCERTNRVLQGFVVAGSNGDPARKWLALHPGSGSERKNWPEERWAQLIELLVRETNLHLLLIGGEVESDRVERLAANVPPERIAKALLLPLQDLASVLAQCCGYIGHDSGISHIAAAVGVKGIILWGETPQEVWRPRGDGIRILRGANGISQLAVEEVWGSLREHLM
jgi:heptosyltransferase III